MACYYAYFACATKYLFYFGGSSFNTLLFKEVSTIRYDKGMKVGFIFLLKHGIAKIIFNIS